MHCPKCSRPTVSIQYLPALNQERAVCSACGWTGPRCFGSKWEAGNVKCRGGNDPTYYNEGVGSHKRPPCDWYKVCAQETTRNKQSMSLPIATQVQQPMAPQMQMPQPQMPQMLPQGPQPVQQQAFPNVPNRPLIIPPPQMNQPGAPVITNPIQAAVMAGINAAPQAQVVIPQAWQRQPQQQQQQFQMPQAQPFWNNTHSFVAPMQFVPPQMAGNPSLVPQNMVAPGHQAMSFLTVPEPAPPESSWLAMAGWSMFRGGAKGILMSLANVIDHVPIGPLRKQ